VVYKTTHDPKQESHDVARKPSVLYTTPGLELSRGVEPPVHVYRDAHFKVKIGFKFQSLGKITNISAADTP